MIVFTSIPARMAMSYSANVKSLLITTTKDEHTHHSEESRQLWFTNQQHRNEQNH